jgi:hypothetical protein
MTNSELYRRGVVFPLTEGACMALSNNDVNERTEVYVIKLNDDNSFYALWEVGFIQELNRHCASLIDEHESECWSPEQVNKALRIVGGFSKDTGRLDTFLAEFKEQILLANIRNMPVFFIF